ncbi:MAG: riboflavin synthase [PS1 clade bacterium]|nr:riboflavin synthase [Rhodobiaceae bacterium]MBL6786537.1 riboflavin synthase [PS1 clade bacterium]CAI8389280.1 MAG: Riboflavin synthase [Rhodobiaceae bacterium UBA7378]HCQ82020.1 riboflavin synthase [Rhodobiaceae bacterium]
MFTGIITDIGRVASITAGGDTRFEIETAYAPDSIDLGASIACSGVCLTVIEKGTREGKNWFAVEASKETLDVTTAGGWQEGDALNLERALKLGDELGGHIVSGHVDAVAEIVDIRAEGDSQRFTFRAPREIMRFVAPKGSITLDGTSLTVNEVDADTFGVNLISHTQSVTTWGNLRAGDQINLEIDVLARYVARLKETEGDENV